MKLLVPGGDGMVARMLGAAAPGRGHEAIRIPKADWDVADPAAAESALDLHRPDVVVNAAAYTDVDGCESRRDHAFRVNAEAPGVLAAACARRSIFFLHLSTDYVFPGSGSVPFREEDPTGPLSVYGASKLAGEAAVKAAGGRAVVLRTAWVYGPWGRNFVATILRIAREQGRLKVVDDQIGAPTYTADLAEAVMRLLEVGATGTVHFTNAGHCSWHGFARAIVTGAGLEVPVEAVPTSAFPRPARRPAFSVLDLSRYRALTACVPRRWEAALADFQAVHRP